MVLPALPPAFTSTCLTSSPVSPGAAAFMLHVAWVFPGHPDRLKPPPSPHSKPIPESPPRPLSFWLPLISQCRPKGCPCTRPSFLWTHRQCARTLLARPNSPSSPVFTLAFPSSLPAFPLGIPLASFISLQAHKHGFSELRPGLLPFSLTLGNILTASASPVIRMLAIPSLFLTAAIHLDSSIGTWKSTYPNPNFH